MVREDRVRRSLHRKASDLEIVNLSMGGAFVFLGVVTADSVGMVQIDGALIFLFGVKIFEGNGHQFLFSIPEGD